MSSPRESWTEEKQSAWLYRVMARAEPEPRRSALFADLARAAEAQAAIWARRFAAGGEPPAPFEPSVRLRLVAALVSRFGPRRLRPVLAAMKVRGLSIYSASTIVAEHPMPTAVEEVGGRHRAIGHGGSLRAAVFGVSDGLVSNTSLILGVAGAEAEPRVLVLTGFAGLLAGAFSMAAGEYVSVRSQRELFEFQIGLEAAELAEYPDEEAEELALIYQARGLSRERAREVARALLRDPAVALDALAREELGLDPQALGSPWGAAISSFLAFAAGALVPLVPFLVARDRSPVAIAAGAALVALFAVGCALSLFTGRSAIWSGVRMVLIGAAAGLTTWLVGHLLGVQLG
jgi:VIT1/CCC1 family predicted Fe2+/Mn2+ transporter